VTKEVGVIDGKGSQLELLPFQSTVLGISSKEAEQRKQVAKPWSPRGTTNQPPPG